MESSCFGYNNFSVALGSVFAAVGVFDVEGIVFAHPNLTGYHLKTALAEVLPVELDGLEQLSLLASVLASWYLVVVVCAYSATQRLSYPLHPAVSIVPPELVAG